MTDATPVDQVVTLLSDGGYTTLPVPVIVGGVPFEFEAFLIGGGRAFDIVVVVDMAVQDNTKLRRKVDALARALDIAGSRRSLTTVTVGPLPDATTVAAMSRVARVLTAEGGAASLRDALAVLLPLHLPSVSPDLSEPFLDVDQWASRSVAAVQLRPLLQAARGGPDSVRNALAMALRLALIADMEES